LKVEVNSYLNYRDFLKDFFKAKKKISPHFSHRSFMLSAGLSSPSHLKMITDGKRNLTNKSLPKYIKALKFSSKKEEHYFSTLVHYNQSQDKEDKISLLENLLLMKKEKNLTPLQTKQFNFLSKWHYVTIYVLTDMKDFNPDPHWIAQKLRKKVSLKQIEKALQELCELQLIEISSDRGYKQTSGALSTPDEIRDTAKHAYHKSMIELASQSLSSDALDSREFNGATLPIPKEKLHLINEKIRSFRKEINELASSYANPDEVYQLNIQFFSLTEDRS
jgi:uncharacterized protein (TIGR02147 family)